ncbi:MAG: hypothetical protein A2254_12095 [Ignavibacteria bacterium RIFOXYA2_FULL_35_9]|nr:MAG: hypothetical protein A2254_12095 [Ignavibacteria bacterium RIFOXYA2_FULL_35_9]
MRSNINFNRKQNQFKGNELPKASDFAFLLLTGFLLTQLLNKLLNNLFSSNKINQVFRSEKPRICIFFELAMGLEPATY